MPNADYYQEQARLLLRWAATASDPAIAQRLLYRAHEMLALADRAAAATAGSPQAPETLNLAVLRAARRRAARERR